MGNVKASIITIGDELLIGQTIDTNSAWIAQHLNEVGIDVLRRVAVGDDADAIRKALDDELSVAELVLVTGGLGPTADDITKPLLCEYFGGKLVVDEKVLAHVKELLTKRKRLFLERNLKQAEVPDNCIALHNTIGSAPGMWFEKEGKIVVAMPGVPFEMTDIMEHEVLPRLQQHFVSDAIVHVSIITAGEAESVIAENIQDLESTLPTHIKLAYLPSPGIVKLRLTGKGMAKELLMKELLMRQGEIADRLGNIVVALEDMPLEYLVGKSLIQRGMKLGLAESCTGGYIAHLITQVQGASAYFMGGIVCYQNEIKERILGVAGETIEQFGVVSEETAIEMAKNALNVLNCDISLSVTGILSPGVNDNIPVGTVWMAIAGSERLMTKRFHFHYDRLRNKEMTAQMGLLMVWKFLNDK